MTSPAELEAARVILARMGIDPQPLIGDASTTRPMPTLAEYIGKVALAVSDATAGVYDTYWRKVIEVWGDRRLDEPTPLEITQLVEHVKTDVIVRRNTRGGRSAAEHLIGALRCVYRFAEDDGLIHEHNNPARRVPKPRRLASNRRALLDAQLHEINTTVATTGNDPHLDTLLIRTHTETACRRGGALALRPFDLDEENCLIRLREKGGTERWQPVSPTLMHHLTVHRDERGDGDPFGPLLRYNNGSPITHRRYDHLWVRIGKHLPWVAAQQISTHWLRYTTLTWVERVFGYAVARPYAGHNGRREIGATATYVRADIYEVALALATLTAEPHPLARTTATVRQSRTSDG
ncbi:tyrosine-type recombinase/integrase [Longispora urticae]